MKSVPKSMASKRSGKFVELYINVIAFASLALTICSTPFNRIFSLIDLTAFADKSFAIICLIPGTSLAYLMLLRPVADSASRTRNPSYSDKLYVIPRLTIRLISISSYCEIYSWNFFISIFTLFTFCLAKF